MAVTRIRAALCSPVDVVIRFPLRRGTGAYVNGSLLGVVKGLSSKVDRSLLVLVAGSLDGQIDSAGSEDFSRRPKPSHANGSLATPAGLT